MLYVCLIIDVARLYVYVEAFINCCCLLVCVRGSCIHVYTGERNLFSENSTLVSRWPLKKYIYEFRLIELVFQSTPQAQAQKRTNLYTCGTQFQSCASKVEKGIPKAQTGTEWHILGSKSCNWNFCFSSTICFDWFLSQSFVHLMLCVLA